MLEFGCKTKHGEKKVFASFDGIAFGVDFELLGVPVLREVANISYELVFAKAKKLCKGVCIPCS